MDSPETFRLDVNKILNPETMILDPTKYETRNNYKSTNTVKLNDTLKSEYSQNELDDIRHDINRLNQAVSEIRQYLIAMK